MTHFRAASDMYSFNKLGADVLAEGIRELLKEQMIVVLAVPGGRSVSGIFMELKSRDIEWPRVHIFMVDEKLVPITHEDSNFRIAKESFLKELIDEKLLPKENVHPFIFDVSKADFGMKEYEQELLAHGGACDIVLLSAGRLGQIGSLYPGHHSIESESEYFVLMNDAPEPPPDRISMSRNLILNSKLCLLLFLGEEKREAYFNFRNRCHDHKSCPSNVVYKVTNSYVLTDIVDKA